MIFVKGYGQMCNNWLQYAHIYAWGREYGVRTVSMRFAYKYRYFHICETPWHNPATYIAAKLLIKTRLIRCLWLQHPRQRTDPEVHRLLSRSPLIAADGWSFRHPQLFMKYRAEIASLFAFRPAKVAAKAAWLRSLPGADVRLGLHIRRGDYARWQGGAYFFADDEYAERVRQFAALFPGKRVQVLVATNDPRADLGLLRSRSGVADMHLTRGNPGEDLYLLSECDYIMGPKSTFSLVAAFYHDHPLHWMDGKDGELTEGSFCRFADVFMDI